MGTPRQPEDVTQVVSPLYDEHVVWGYLLGECGRTREEVYVLCACGDLGIDFANAIRALLQREWLLGGHGPSDKPERDPPKPMKNIEEHWPEELAAFAELGNKIVDLVQKADALVRAAKTVVPALKTLNRMELSRWQFEGQMMCAMVLLGAEKRGLKQPTSMEMAAIAALLGEKLNVPELQKRFDMAQARAEAWEKQIRKAKDELLPVIRGLGLFCSDKPAPGPPMPASQPTDLSPATDDSANSSAASSETDAGTTKADPAKSLG